MDTAIELANIHVRYKVARDRIPSLKEYAIRRLKHRFFYDEFHALQDISVLVRSGELIGIEVKHGATVGRSDADGIESLKEQFPKVFRFGLVLYLGESVIPLSVHAVAVPLSAFFGS